MEIKKDYHEKIINCGVFNYNAQKLANILGFDKKEVESEMQNKESELNQLLQKGKDMSDYVIDLKLFELAKSGDIKALEKLNQRTNNVHR